MADTIQHFRAADQKKGGGLPTKEDRHLAMLVWLSSLFLGFVPGLIFYLLKRKNPGWLLEQTKESLNFGITIVIYCFASSVVLFFLIGLLLIPVILIILILNMVVTIRGATKAYGGESYRLPLVLHLVK